MRYYSEDHLWIEPLQSGRFRLGLADEALKHLQEVVMLFFPLNLIEERSCVRGDLLAVMESTKSAIDIQAPCDLVDLEINRAVEADPSLIHQGTWLVEALLKGDVERELWMSAEEYAQFLGKQLV